MVEELKLAIKIDDASIEQSLLKQFANAQKMADKVVLDFKNVNFDDKQVEAKFKEMQKKAGQNPIDLTISDNALDMLGQIDKRLTEIFSIGKGKSFIDSSSITADIGKIENKINELDKKYEEAQKKLSSIGSGNISGKDVNLVDNEEFKKLSQEVSELKNQFDDLKTHMQLLDDYTVSTDRFFELQSQVETTTVKVSDLVEEFTKLSNAQKALSFIPQESNISSGSDSAIEPSNNAINKWREYDDVIALGLDRIEKLQKLSQKGISLGVVDEHTLKGLIQLPENLFNRIISDNDALSEIKSNPSIFGKWKDGVRTNAYGGIDNFDTNINAINNRLKTLENNIDQTSTKFQLLEHSDSWTHFGTIDSNGNRTDNGIYNADTYTYKIYSTFEDLSNLTSETISKIMSALSNAGFKGQLKYGNEGQAFSMPTTTDQLVLHGASIEDQRIAYNVLKEQFGDLFSYIGGGFDEAIATGSSFSGVLTKNTLPAIEKITDAARKEYDALSQVNSEQEKQKNNTSSANVSSSTDQMKDAFPNADAKPETEGMKQVEEATHNAVQAKKDFATANEGVQSSIDGSENPLKLEAELMGQIAKSAREAADAKKEFVEANKQVKNSADGSNSENKKKDKYAKRRKISEEDFLNFSPSRVNENLSNSGYTILGETVNTELVDGLVKVSAKIKDVDGVWKSFSAKVDADGNIFEQRFKTVTNGVDKLETALKNFGRETSPALTYQETLDKAQKIKNSLNLGDEYSIKVDSSEFVTITKKLTDVENTGASVTQTFKSAQDAIDNFGKSASNSAERTSVALKSVKSNIKEVTDESEKLANAQKEQNVNANLNKYDKQLDSYNSKVDKYQATIARFNDGGWTSDKYLDNVQAVKDAVKKYKDLLNNIRAKGGITSEEDIQNLKEYESEIKNTIATVTNMSAAEKGYNFVSGQKELDKIHKLLNENSKMSSEAKAKIKAYYTEIESGNPSMSLDRIHGEIMKIYNAEVEAGRAGRSFFDTLKNSGFHQLAAQMSGMFGFYDVINLIKQAATAVTELNTQITELAKVSEDSVSQIYADFDSYANIAKEMGSTISDTIAATTAWSKNGYNIPDSKELAEVSLLYKNVGDGINIDEANELLVSTLKGFKLEADQAEHIVDVFNEVSNREPISSSGIGEALQRSAASFNAANTSLEKSVALVTATNSVLQDPEKVGNMWKTVSARIRGAKTELEEAGEDTDGMVESTSKLQALIKGMTGFDIMESDGKTFKDIYDIIIGIGEKWQDLNDVDRASLLEKLAGKNQSNALAAAISQVDVLKKAYGEATNAEGSAREENSKYQQSVQYSIDQTKAKLEELANDTLNSNFIKGLINAGGKIIDILDIIIKNVGILKPLIAGLAIKNIVKNFD